MLIKWIIEPITPQKYPKIYKITNLFVLLLVLALPAQIQAQERRNQFNGQVGAMVAVNQEIQGGVSQNNTQMLTALGLRNMHETKLGNLVARGLVQVLVSGDGYWEAQELNIGLENEAYGAELGVMFPGSAQVGKHYLDRNVDASPFVGEPIGSSDFLRLSARKLGLKALLGAATQTDADEGDYIRETQGLYWSGKPVGLIFKLALIHMTNTVNAETNPDGLGGTYDGRSDKVQALGMGKKISQVQVSLNGERRSTRSGHTETDLWDRATNQLIFDWKIIDTSGMTLVFSQQATDTKSSRQDLFQLDERQRVDLSWRYDHLDTWYFLMASKEVNKTDGNETRDNSQLAFVAIHNF